MSTIALTLLESKTRLMELTQLNLEDMHKAFELNALLRPVITPFMQGRAEGFAKDLIAFDADIEAKGLQWASASFCKKYTEEVRISGQTSIPKEGPLLILSNHPGLCDSVALFSQIPRPELSVIALDRTFLRALPALRKHLFLLSADKGQKASILRQSARYLNSGNSILTFPAGRIEADPFVREGTLASMATWSESITQLSRVVPKLTIVMILVAGVFNPKLLHHPVTKFKRATEDKELLAAALQIAFKRYQRNTIDLIVTDPIRCEQISQDELKTLMIARGEKALSTLGEGSKKKVFY